MPADDQPWIASRCMRLLRPITSRLTTLRKEHENQEAIAREARIAAVAVAKANTTTVKARKPRGFDKVRDPDWVPGARPVAGAKRTYGGRPARKPEEAIHTTSASARPGAIPFTPIVSRANHSVNAISTDVSPTRRHKKGPLGAIQEQVQTLKRRLRPDIAKSVEALLDAYAKLLHATSWCEDVHRTGSRKFMDVCLRQLSKYIENEEHFAQVDKEEDGVNIDDDRDISDEVYTQLQQLFEAEQGRGWRPLGKAVRAHATDLLCKAFTDGVLGNETFHAVVVLCFRKEAWLEAELFLSDAVRRLKPVLIPSNLQSSLFDPRNSLFLALVHQLVVSTGRYGLLYSMLAYMLRESLLPLEWLATECMQPVWNRLVSSLNQAEADAVSPALDFLETVVFEGAGISQDVESEPTSLDPIVKRTPSARKELRDALETTYFSLFTILSSLARIVPDHFKTDVNSHRQGACWMLHSTIAGILRRNDLRDGWTLSDDTTPEDAQTFAKRLLWAMTSALCGHSEFEGLSVKLSVPTLIKSLTWTCNQYAGHEIDTSELLATMPRFIASTARCSGRAQQDDGLSAMQEIVNTLLLQSKIRLPAKTWDLKRLALESAYEFAHQTNEKDHFLYAKQVEKLVSHNGRITIDVSPHKHDTPSAPGGFRWEEGMGELVACTPFPKRKTKPGRLIERLPSPESLPIEEVHQTVQSVHSDSSGDSDDDQQQQISSFVANSPGTPASSLGDNSVPSSPMAMKSFGRQTSSMVVVPSREFRGRGSSPVVVIPANSKRISSSSPMVIIPAQRSRHGPLAVASVSSISSMSSRSSEEMEPRRKTRTCRLKSSLAAKHKGSQGLSAHTMPDRLRRTATSLNYSEILESSDTDEDELVPFISRVQKRKRQPEQTTTCLTRRPKRKVVNHDKWAFMDSTSADELSFDL